MSNEELAKRIKNGESDLMGIILRQNAGMIHRIAGRYYQLAERGGSVSFDDLVQSATLGAIEAVKAWEPERGAFITLAVFYMRTECRRALGMASTKQRIENARPIVPLDSPAFPDGDTTFCEVQADETAIDPETAAIIVALMKR